MLDISLLLFHLLKSPLSIYRLKQMTMPPKRPQTGMISPRIPASGMHQLGQSPFVYSTYSIYRLECYFTIIFWKDAEGRPTTTRAAGDFTSSPHLSIPGRRDASAFRHQS